MSYSCFRRQKPDGSSVYICFRQENPPKWVKHGFIIFMIKNRLLNTCRSVSMLIKRIFSQEDFLTNTCSFTVTFSWFSSAALGSCGLWALWRKHWGRGRCRTPSSAVWASLSPGLWAVLFLTSGRRDAVTGMNSHGRVLCVNGRTAVGLENGLLLCHSGSMRRCQSDEEGRHHSLLWSCRCHGRMRPTTLRKRTQLLLSTLSTL